MNLSEDKKAPLRKKSMQEKRAMLFMQVRAPKVENIQATLIISKNINI